MRNRDLAEAFVNGATKGKGSNMYIEGHTIYSYGSHFPLAIRFSENSFYVNRDIYSQSTSQHQSYLRNAFKLNQTLMYRNTKEMWKLIR